MNNPSTIGPDELLTVRFPDLKENQVIIPGTTILTFNISLAGTDVNSTLVGNLGRNIIRKLIVKLEGNEIISTDDYDVLYSYYDCWKCTYIFIYLQNAQKTLQFYGSNITLIN